MVKKRADAKKKAKPGAPGGDKSALSEKTNTAGDRERTGAKDSRESGSRTQGKLTIVGIGASAGGLEAIESFFQHMDPGSGMAFVLVQHLDPTHKSILSELVGRFTKMPVQEVTQSLQVKPDHVYVIPPNRDLAILNSRLQLLDPTGPRHLRLSIDYFFRSLAQEARDSAVAIVLSGTGSDGTLGLRAIKGEGGLVLVQDPTSAAYDGMPRSAISTGLADAILQPAEMARQLLAYARNATYPHTQPAGIPGESKDDRERLFVLLRSETGHDFSLYKDATITRRILRRMTINDIESEADYIKLLQRSAAELDALWKEFLIRVTQFFRDPQVFESLEKSVFPALLNATGPNEELRIWIPACSTGEEAYSIAMLMHETMENMGAKRDVQIFATDIDQVALEIARAGAYPENIVSDVSKERLTRFFSKTKNTYVVGNELRRLLVFSSHDVIKDPPFSRMDLISCRNLLIYMKTELQSRVLGLFHYALNDSGFLILGNSETAGAAQDLFTEYNRKLHLYQQKPRAMSEHRRLPYTGLFHSMGLGGVVKGARKRGSAQSLREATEKALLDLYSPTCVVVDDTGTMLYVHGETGRYLEATTGEANLNIVRLARKELSIHLSAALREANIGKTEVRYRSLRVDSAAGAYSVNLRVRPLPALDSQKLSFLVLFEEAASGKQPGDTAPEDAHAVDTVLLDRTTMLEQELASTREVLQTANEELQTSNEELSSTVEELQSTNEELLTSQEELRSVNEELLTVNAELEGKLEQLAEANADKENILASTDVGTIFLDLEQKVKWFSSSVSRVIYLIEGDVGRPISHLSHSLKDVDLVALVEQVMDTLTPVDREVRDDTGGWYDLRITLYRTELNAIEGTVVSLFDISERKHAKQFALFRKLLESSPDATVIADASGAIYMINRQAEELFGWTREEILGRPVELLMPERHRKKHRKHQERFLQQPRVRGMAAGSALACQRKDGSEFLGQISLSPIETEMGILMYTAIRDVSMQKQAEMALRHAGGIYKCMEQLERVQLNGARDRAKVLQGLCRKLVKEAGYSQCWINIRSSKDKSIYTSIARAGFPKDSRSHLDSMLLRVSGRDKVTVVHDIMVETDYIDLQPIATLWNFKSLASFPLCNGKRVLGTLGVHAMEATAFDGMELTLLRALSKRLSLYLMHGLSMTRSET
ncbi:MAG TPA: chemotaxis protein CheB [Gammaproteobacteria bacterium]|nr:chemotaxis protein CheB [Gammaproteobacteria bacterium]